MKRFAAAVAGVLVLVVAGVGFAATDLSADLASIWTGPELNATEAAEDQAEAIMDHLASYAFLEGRSGGQVFYGGTASGNGLAIVSTSHATKGSIYLGSSSTELVVDDVNDRVGIGTSTPQERLHVHGAGADLIISSSSDVAHGLIVRPGSTGADKAQLYVSGGNNNHSGRLRLDNGNGDATIAYIEMYNAAGTLINYIANSGDSYFNGGDVGIGVTNPGWKLDVRTAEDDYAFALLNTGNSTARKGMWIQAGEQTVLTGTATFIDFFQNDSSTLTGACTANSSGTFSCANLSDGRRKTGVGPTRLDATGAIEALQITEFQRTSRGEDGKEHPHRRVPAGFMAEQVQQVYPEAVVEHHTGLLMMDNGALVPVLVKALQEANARAAMQDLRLFDLEARLEALDARRGL